MFFIKTAGNFSECGISTVPEKSYVKYNSVYTDPTSQYFNINALYPSILGYKLTFMLGSVYN